MKVVELFTDLAKKAGITDLTDPKYADFLSSNLEIDDDTAKKIQSELFNFEAAKANPKVKGHFFAQAMNGVDTEVDRWLTDEDFNDEDKTLIKSQESSTKKMVTAYQKKIEKMSTRLKDIEAGKGKKETPGEADKLREDINKLNAEKGTLIADHNKQIQALKEQHTEALNERDLDMILGSYNYVFPKEMKLPAKIAAVKAVLNPELKTKGLKLQAVEGSLVLVKSDGTKYFNDQNQETTLSQFIDKVLADNNLLAVSDPNSGNSGGSNPPPPTTTTGNPGKGDPALLKQIQSDMANVGIK